MGASSRRVAGPELKEMPMGFLDNIKDALTTDDKERADKKAAEAKHNAEEAQKQAAEAQAKLDAARKDEATAAEAAMSDEEKAARAKAEADKAAAEKAAADKAAADKTAAAKAAAPAPHAAVTYTVKPGDTLSGIAAKYGVSYMDIARANNIPNPDLIYPGQVFTIPGK